MKLEAQGRPFLDYGNDDEDTPTLVRPKRLPSVPIATEEIILELRRRGLYEDARRVAKAHDITLEQMFSKRRHKGEAMARQAFWAELYARGTWSYPQIGALCARDHTTVMFGIKAHMARASKAAGC